METVDDRTISLTRRNRGLIDTFIVEQELKITKTTDAFKDRPSPLTTYIEEPLLPLVDACAPLDNIVHNLSTYAYLALNQTPDQPPDGLTVDESASIHLYTIEWNLPNESLYWKLNHALRNADDDPIRPYFKYLKILLTALVKLPSVSSKTVWRGVTVDLNQILPRGALLTWWSFSSCTNSLSVLENNMYLANAGERTLFSIEAINGRSIRAHSYYDFEDEILLLPGTRLEVQSQLRPAPGSQIIHLKQIKPTETLLELPFEDALLYPSEKQMVWYKNRKVIAGLSLLIILSVAVIIIGSVIGTKRSSSVSVLYLLPNSTCQPSFAPIVSYPTGTSPVSIAVADFNGDNIIDLAVCNSGNNTVSVFLNTGTGSLVKQTSLYTGLSPQSITTGNFNNDNKTDLIVCNYDNSSVSIFLGYGNGSFAEQSTFPAGSSFSIVASDFNNDNQTDIVVALYINNAVGILLGNGNGSFREQTTFPTSTSPLAIVIGDFNSDNRKDIAVTNNNNNTVSILLGYDNGSFATQILLETGSHPNLIAAGDLNGDNQTDLVVSNNDGKTVGVHLGYGNGSFATQTTFLAGFGPLPIALADFNGDRILDIIVGTYDGGAISILIGYGNGSFADRRVFPTGSKPQAMAAADFNGDHKQDVAIANYGENTVDILLNTCQ